MRKRAYFSLALAALVFPGAARAADPRSRGFTDCVYKEPDGQEVRYVLFVPHEYQGEKSYPLILFLHGAGERDGGKKTPVEVGIGPAIKRREGEGFPFFVLIPRCGASPRNWQADGPDAQRALAMLQDVQKAYKIDPKRICLTGLSMGGFGTWSLAAKYPERWAVGASMATKILR